MTVCGRLAEQLLGPARAARLLDGSPEQSAQFAGWYVAAWHGAHTDPLVAIALANWQRILDDPKIWQWAIDGNGRPPILQREALVRAPVGVMRIEIRDDGNWIPAEGEAGLHALTWCELRGSPAQGIDVIAVHPTDRRHWRRYTGLCDVMPHEDAIYALEPDESVRIFGAPLDWIAGGCPTGAICVLDWGCAAARHLLELIDRAEVAAVCDGPAHAQEIRALARPRRPALQLRIETASAAIGAAS